MVTGYWPYRDLEIVVPNESLSVKLLFVNVNIYWEIRYYVFGNNDKRNYEHIFMVQSVNMKVNICEHKKEDPPGRVGLCNQKELIISWRTGERDGLP